MLLREKFCRKRGRETVNIAVCDDQLEELKAVESLLRAWQEQQCAAIRLHLFHNAGELLEAARKERFTLYLLDVMMPGTSGMAAAREIRTFDSAADIVFLTSSPGFAYESYGVQALEYLLKPITAKKALSASDPPVPSRAEAAGSADAQIERHVYPRPVFRAFVCGGQRQASLFQYDKRSGARGCGRAAGI